MGANNLNQFTQDAYSYGLRRLAHQLLAWGYQDAKAHIHCKLEEEDITGLIAKAIKNRLDSPSTPSRFNRYGVIDEELISSEGRMGKHRRKLDLVVTDSHKRPRTKYIFEAKRLRKGSHSIGKYVGKDGMQCFIHGIYGQACRESAMLGYLQSDGVPYWESELRRRLDNDRQEQFQTIQSLQKAQTISRLPHTWTSEHKRKRNQPILLYHIFLDCSANC